MCWRGRSELLIYETLFSAVGVNAEEEKENIILHDDGHGRGGLVYVLLLLLHRVRNRTIGVW